MVWAEGAPGPNHGDLKDLNSRSLRTWGWNKDKKVKITWKCCGWLSRDARDKAFEVTFKDIRQALERQVVDICHSGRFC